MKIEPDFEIDKKGRVICRYHSNYHYFIDSHKDYFEDMSLDLEITCKTCIHYTNDDCYFSKSLIDEIELKRISKKSYNCKFCGDRIHRMQSILYTIYNKEAFAIDTPLTCRNCYDNIFKGEFIYVSKKKIIIDIFIFLFLMYSLFILISLMNIYDLIIIYFFLWLIPWGIFLYLDLRRFLYNIFGLKYYKKYFPKFEDLTEMYVEEEY